MKSILLSALISATISSAALANDFTLTSTDVAEGKTLSSAQILNGFGCTGGNKSPQLSWSAPPAGTKSFVLTVYDPDAPTGSGWWHWVVFNIPASARSLDTDASAHGTLPTGAVESRTDFGKPGYGGACPPPGKAHRYIFRLTALSTDKLDLDANASPALVGFSINASRLGETSIKAVYGR